MKRFSHIIKPNKNSEMPSRVIFFDTETTEIHDVDNEQFLGSDYQPNEIELQFKLASACYRYLGKQNEVWKDIHSRWDFWEFVESKAYNNSRLYLVAHNVQFDFRVLKGFLNLRQRGWTTKKIIFNGTSNIWQFTKGKKTLIILDNMNYFKSSLAVLGASIGINKMEMDATDDKKLMEYCRNDVKIMVKAWDLYLIFLQENDLGNFQKTIASQAFGSFRHRFMKTKIHIHTNEKIIALERESYHGARTEAFRIGKMLNTQMYFLVDVNSMYPSIMREYDYPHKLVRSDYNLDLNIIKILLKKYCLVAKCIVNVDVPIYPTKQNDRLIFPVGKFETVLTTREIEYGIEHNYIEKFIKIASYEKANLFKEYVDFFYSKKLQYQKEGNDAFYYMCKLFLNSLYGKFGQRINEYKKVSNNNDMEDGVITLIDGNINKEVTFRNINGLEEKSVGLIEGFDSFVSIASHITADARMRLWKYFEIAGRDNVYYCDTDSMITNARGYLNCKRANVISDELGDLSLKGHTTKLEIYGAKDYVFDEDKVIKGIRKDATRIGESEFTQVRFEGMAGAIRNNRLNKMVISNVTKKLSRIYTKGDVMKDGKVAPFVLNYQPPLFNE